jgi:UDP-N-acetylmuramyl pentapeptide phosphotransferase/UDP-N-acetylglucosamine-1-phosphate transferase
VALFTSSTVVGPYRTSLAVVAFGFGAIGLIEDIHGIPPLRRLTLQTLIAIAALPWLLDGLHGGVAWQVLFAIGTVAWLLAYVNAFNFMDGINGISVAQALVAGLVWYGIGTSEGTPVLGAGGLIVAAAAAGFAPFNFPRARMFLGDVGSYFLGGWIAVLVVIGLRDHLPPEAVVAPVAVYLVDTATTLVRRFRRGERWYMPHREHVYQRLTQLNGSHVKTTGIVTVVMASCAGLGWLSLTGSRAARIGGDIALSIVLVIYVEAPRLLARSRAAPLPPSVT